jgi:hypothetical protein
MELQSKLETERQARDKERASLQADSDSREKEISEKFEGLMQEERKKSASSCAKLQVNLLCICMY